METCFIHTPHSRLYVKSFGGTISRLLILLHGGPGTPDYLEKVAVLLQDRFHVLCFDQRGTGRSETLNHSYALSEYLEDIWSVARHFGYQQFHLFGHSWGGLLAQLYAKDFPTHVQSLFLCNPVPGTGRQWTAMIAEESLYITRRATWADLKRLLAASFTGHLVPNRADESWRNFYDIVWKHYFKKSGVVPEMDQEWAAGIRAEPILKTVKTILKTSPSLLHKISLPADLPVGILYGQDDFLQRTRKPVLKRFPQAKLYEVKQAGHVPWISNLEAFAQCLSDFYNKKSGN